MKLRAQASIEREYRKATKAVRKLPTGPLRNEAYGVMQALAWVLRDNAMAPVKALGPLPTKDGAK